MSSLKTKVSGLETTVEVQENKLRALRAELDESEEARRNLKFDINELNEKIIVFEEELFESKTI